MGLTQPEWCCWQQLLRSEQVHAKLFTCLRAWRYVTLQRKHRFHAPTPREWQQARFFEMELPLHAVVTSLDYSKDESFELLCNFFALFPSSSDLLDHQRRPPLYYALEQHWELDKLSWLVDKSLSIVMERDSGGLGIITHAIESGCPEEMVIRLAVEAASRCIVVVDEFLNGRHYENAGRFCNRALLQLFAGVPKFPHSRCRNALTMRSKGDENNSHTCAVAFREIWSHYVDTWGHFGPPLLQRDLPDELCPVIDSFVEVSLVAKGEPLTYQWFVQLDEQAEPIALEDATQSFIFLSQSIQPHNEGIYFCEVTNRRGRVTSTKMRVKVVDDRVPPDPTKNFVVDTTHLRAGEYEIRNLKASTGGGVYHTRLGAALSLLPNFFVCLDREGNNVSDSHGAEIAIVHRVEDETRLQLRKGERLMSCIVELLPTTMGELLRPASLWLPHCLEPDADNYGVIMDVDAKTGRLIRDIHRFDDRAAVVRASINRLGVFAVISRQRPLRPSESSVELPVERARLLILHPQNLSSNVLSNTLKVFVVLVRDLPNCCGQAEALLRSKINDADTFTTSWTIESFKLRIRENFSLNLLVGGRHQAALCWPAPEPAVVCLELPSPETESQKDATFGSSQAPPAFIEIAFQAVVMKTPIQTRLRGNRPEVKNLWAVPNNECPLFEDTWCVFIPVLHDVVSVFGTPPAKPVLLERTSNQLVLSLEPCTLSNSRNVDNPQAADGSSRYFYVVELAVFSPTFWQRYDQTWWFDKTKTAVIDGMYKVVHRGYDTKVTISTTAYAGCVRVAWCSIDCFGTYSEPMLLTPLHPASSPPYSSLSEANQPGWSIQLQETTYRVTQLVENAQLDETVLKSTYGMPQVKLAADVVQALQDAKRSLRSCHFELALLLSGLNTLERQVSCIKLASTSYTRLFTRFLTVRRAVPELDCGPVAMAAVIRQLHELLREAVGVVEKLSSPGWMKYLLMDDWLEDAIADVLARTAGVFADEGSALECSTTLQAQLRASSGESFSQTMKQERSFLLLIAGHLDDIPNEQTKLAVCRELGYVLKLMPSQQQDDDTSSGIAAELLSEFESLSTKTAVDTLRKQDCLEKHLVRVTPSNEEKCSSLPEAVHLDLDVFIRGVNPTSMHLVMRVSNLSANGCAVQGKNSFCERTGRLSFVPAAEFERKSRYRVTVREHEILSSLGGTLPERPPYVLHFSTPA